MSTDTNYADEVMKLKYEYKALKDEVLRNNQHIQELQLRDMQSVENMKSFLDKKRQLNSRTKRLKLCILQNFLERRGCTLNMDEWLAALNISPDFGKNVDELIEFDNDRHLSEFDVAVKQKTDDFLQDLAFKIENVLNAVKSNDSGEAKDEDSDGVHIEKACNLKSESIESLLKFFQQPCNMKPIEKRDSQTSPRVTSLTDQQVQTTPSAVHYAPVTLNYPTNVELKSVNSPPILPAKRKTATCFTTKYDIRRKRKASDTQNLKIKSKHKDVGDYMVHRNTTSTPFIRTATPEGVQSRAKCTNFLFTVTIVATVAALFYVYPSLPNCILFLKDGIEQSRDELARILESLISYYNVPLVQPKIKEPEAPDTVWTTVVKFIENVYQSVIEKISSNP